MKLDSLHLSQWRQFRESFAINDLSHGINLFVGPNESGKSTLVGAIRAAFFERHKASSASVFQPWGDSSAEPAVALVFQWNNSTWKLEKRFLGRQRCDLEVDGAHFSGDEAEDKLAQLMGYSFSGRGASKAEHHGIPGLLWVQQGAIQEIQDPVTNAGEYLQSAIGEELGAITSGSGDRLLTKVTALHNQILTKAGRPRGDYKKVAAELESASTELSTLDAEIKVYEDKVDALARLQEQRQRDDSGKPWLALRQHVDAAKAKLRDIETLLDAQKQAQADVDECMRHQDLLRDKLAGFEKSAAQLKKRASDKAQARGTLDDCQARQASVQSQQHNMQAAYAQADAAFKHAREQARRQRLEAQHEQLQSKVKTNQKTLQQLQQLQVDLRELREKRQDQAIDASQLERLKKLQKALDTLDLRKEVAATRLRWTLHAKQELSLNGQPISGSDERLLLETTELIIPDVGTLRLVPGGKDIASLAREQAQLQDERDNLQLELAIDNLAHGEQRAASCARLDAEIQQVDARIDALAPTGADALAQQLDLDEKQRAHLAAQIDACPPPQADVLDEAEAERAREQAQTSLDAANTAAQDHKQALMLAQQALTRATAEWQQLEAECSAPLRQQEQRDASRDLTDLKARQATLERDIAQRKTIIDAARPDALKDDIKRFGDSADALESAARERERDIDRLQTELETLGAQGLADKRDDLRQTLDHLARRHTELTRRAEALKRLLELLQSTRQALTRSLQAPLQKHLDHYLGLLFPGASIRVDEKLVPTVLVHQGQHGQMSDLSYGTREQMGLISRLAYADLLRDAGQPTLVILDDALVHSDATRLAHMKRVLYDAAKRHQVLLFTCHPDNWSDLGVAARDLATLKVAAA